MDRLALRKGKQQVTETVRVCVCVLCFSMCLHYVFMHVPMFFMSVSVFMCPIFVLQLCLHSVSYVCLHKQMDDK